MGKIIANLNSKGGVGKTTNTLHCAQALGSTGARVALVDADGQGSAMLWAQKGQLAPSIQAIALSQTEFSEELARISGQFDWVVVDGEPRASSEATLATIDAADLILVPCPAAPMDIWSAAALITEIQTRRPDRPFLVVPTMMSRTRMCQEAVEAMQDIWPVTRTHIGRRSAYPSAAAVGRTVWELPERESLAARAEMSALMVEVITWMAGRSE